MPEPIVKQDGTEKNDCERNAAKRFVTKFRQDHPHLKVIVTEDSLSSNAPHIETLQAHNMRYILGVKEGDHAFLFEQVVQAERAGRVTYYDRDDPKAKVRHRFRFVSNVPLNASHPDLRVNFIECWETTADGKVQHFSWITDLRVNKGTVYQLMRGARARWRIENETFNTLKNQGYHFEHNFGHGYQHLSVVFATLMVLAFLVDQIQQLCCPLFQAAWAKWGSKRLLWEKMRAYFYIYALESMRHLFEALCDDLRKPTPNLGERFVLMSRFPASLFVIWRPLRGGALSNWQPNVAGHNAALRFSRVKERRTPFLGSEKGSGRALRHKSYRIFETGGNCCLASSLCQD